MRLSKTIMGTAGLALAALAASACSQPAANTAANASAAATPAVNTAPAAGASPASPTDTGTGIEAREPERYRATYVVSGQTTGAQQSGAATNVEVARDGARHRIALDTRIPGVGKVIFLDHPDKRYLILEGQRQYMELTPEMTGIAVPRSMTVGGLVEQLQRQRGVERLAEEQVNGRTAVKYRIAGQAQTGTQAGQVAGESFVWIDKETGLPVRAQGATAASGQVQGATGALFNGEVRDIQTTVDPALLELPQGFRAMSQEEVQRIRTGLETAFRMLAGVAVGAAPAGTPPGVSTAR